MNTAVDDLELSAHYTKYEEKIYNQPGNVLVPESHARLVENLDSVAQTARVPKKYIYLSIQDTCNDKEKEWAGRYRKEGKAGLVYLSTASNVTERMMALTGAFIRNFKDARMYTVQDIVEDLKEGSMDDCTVLAIPNFHISGKGGKSIPAWQTSSLMGLLLHRYISEKPTLLYIADWESLSKDYGTAMKDHIQSNYIEIAE